jgi:hypothetical protein
MLHNRFNPLHAPASDAPPANSGTAPTTPEPAPESEGEEKTEEEPAPEPAPEPEKPAETPSAAVKPLSAFDRGALRALGMGALISRVEVAESLNATQAAEIARLTAENSRIACELAAERRETPAKIEAAAKGRENEVSRGVRAQLTQLGISEAAAPAQINSDGTPEAKLEHFATLKGAEKTAYYREHKADLKAAEAARNSK